VEPPGASSGLFPLFSVTGLPRGAELYFGDVDGNAASDLLVLEPATRRLSVRKATNAAGSAGFEPQPSEVITLGAGSDEPTIRVVDFNADGRADVLQMQSTGVYALWLRNAEGTAFLGPGSTLGVPLSAGHGAPSEAAFGDFDGDGAVDAARVSLETARVFFWRFWFTGGRWQFDRATQGAGWEVAIPPPVASGASYAAGLHRTGNFAGGAQDELLLPAGTREGGATEATLIGLGAIGAGGPRAPAQLPPGAPSVVRQWATGFGSAAEITSADVDRDGYQDLVELANSGGAYVWRGGGSHARVSTSLGLPDGEIRCVGSPPERTTFADLDGRQGIDLVRAPRGSGDIDVWLGAAASPAGTVVANFTSGQSWATVDRGARKIAAIQAQGWAAGTPPAPGADEIAVQLDDGDLAVYGSTLLAPAAPALSDPSGRRTVEGRIADGFRLWLGKDRLSTEKYPTESATIELSHWRFTGDDAACRKSIRDYEKLMDRAAGRSVPWFAASLPIDWTLPPSSDVIGNSDGQARQIINFFVAYRVLGQPRFLAAAESSAVALLDRWPRFPHAREGAGGRVCPESSCLTFVQKDSFADDAPAGAEADPNQNLEVALAFALLMNEPRSAFHRAKLGGGRLYGAARHDLWDIIASEVAIAFSVQRDQAPSSQAFEGALLVHESEAYRATQAYDTRYGAYALSSAVWLRHETSSDPLYRTLLGPRFEANLRDASAWLNRWSRSTSTGGAVSSAVSYYCGQGGHPGCEYVSVHGGAWTLTEWDAWNRIAPLHYLNGPGSPACPDQVLDPALQYDELEGFQPLETLLLMGVPRSFFSEKC
jgi:hypothetical protein